MPVMGFQESQDSPALIRQDAAALNSVAVDGVRLALNGRGVVASDPGLGAQVDTARARQLPAELVLSNPGVQGFSEPAAHALFSSRGNRDAVVGELSRTVRVQGWSGVCIDLESLRGRDQGGLVALLGDLRRALPGRQLTITVPNATSHGEFGADGLDLPAIARIVDHVILLAYDEHTQGDPPGPIGALGWQRAGVSVLLASGVPRSKVDLGVARYGYIWRGASVERLSDAQARAMVTGAHARATWVGSAGEWTAQLPGGARLWWSDGRSFAQRVALASRYGLAGVAVWSLGLAGGAV